MDIFKEEEGEVERAKRMDYLRKKREMFKFI